MKKTLAAGFLLLAIVMMGASCSTQSNVTVNGDASKTSNAMTDEPKAAPSSAAMVKDSGAMMNDSGSAAVGVDVQVDTGVMMKKDGGAMMKKEPAMATTAKGTYEAYSASKLELAKQGKVVLFFKASWCPTCKAVDADILTHLSAIPSGTHILIVDYDTSAELKKKYGVTYQHTFVQVDAQGTMLKKWSGSPTLASLIAEIK